MYFMLVVRSLNATCVPCVYRLLGLLENFLSTVKWLEHNVTYVARNIEMDLRYITWIDHDHGASFVSIVSEYYGNFHHLFCFHRCARNFIPL